MKYTDIIITTICLTVITCMAIVKPASAALVCKVEPSTGYIICYEDSTINYQYPKIQPSYKVDIEKPYVPPHNWGDCMISMGCTR